jgi:tRNA(Ile)-lysidine synthase
VETVLLKLLRGAGPEGLSGMRPLRALGSGTLWRPLLDLPREALLTHVAAHELSTLDDPSNTDPRVARGYLRGTVLPALLERWPQAAASIVHSARLCLEATASLRAVWMESLDALRRDEDTLDAKGWLALTPALRAPLLDHWLHSRGLTAPTTAQREQLERQIHEGAAERLPLVGWLDTEVRVWRGRLWAMRRHAAFDTSWSAMWTGEALRLPGGGTLTLTPGDSRLRQPLRVAYRTGGETLKPQGDRHTRELRDLFQQGGVPPWRRPRMPLLWLNRELVAVGPRWISEQGRRLLEEAGAGLLWNEDD